ncbi:MAG: nucleotide exchange factor GrpE [Candidatus Wildermuthbacteria bacterium]|nr:nucleotide exchange factor GrpE [Candidatus Wildermuthbacteria bacterium]
MAEEKSIEEIKKERDEYLAGWQRARADFINYKKEEMERIRGLMEYAEAEFLLNILPILDNVERAEKNISDQARLPLGQGFLQIGQQIKNFLKSHGVEELKTEKEKFSPEFHEAVEEVEGTGLEQGTVTEVVEKGYMLHGKLLRPAKVKIIQ